MHLCVADGTMLAVYQDPFEAQGSVYPREAGPSRAIQFTLQEYQLALTLGTSPSSQTLACDFACQVWHFRKLALNGLLR